MGAKTKSAQLTISGWKAQKNRFSELILGFYFILILRRVFLFFLSFPELVLAVKSIHQKSIN
jgi:hypothetical protein